MRLPEVPMNFVRQMGGVERAFRNRHVLTPYDRAEAISLKRPPNVLAERPILSITGVKTHGVGRMIGGRWKLVRWRCRCFLMAS